jgi:hypothetical protein
VRAEGESPICRAGIPGHVAEQAGLMLAFLEEVDQEAAQEWEW